jgi:hypothetical protein
VSLRVHLPCDQRECSARGAGEQSAASTDVGDCFGLPPRNNIFTLNFRGLLDPFDDSEVAGAAAKIAYQGIPNIKIGGVRVAV